MGRDDPTSPGAVYERLVNVDRLTRRIAGIVSELSPAVAQLRRDTEQLRAKVAQQQQMIAELRTTIDVMRAEAFSGAATTRRE